MNKVIYNVTVSVDAHRHEEWLSWMQSVHIPEVMQTGFFLSHRICRVHAFEDGGVTYAIQYVCLTQAHLDEYQEKCAPALQKDHQDRFGAHTAAFRTLLEILGESGETTF